MRATLNDGRANQPVTGPDIRSAQRAAKESPDAARSVDAARKKLSAWGLTDEQIAAIEKAGQAFETVNVLAPASGVVTKRSVVAGDYVQEGSPLFDVADLGAVWLLARVYEEDLPLVTVGRKVTATTTAYRDRPIEGVVAFVEPTVDRASRTVAARSSASGCPGARKARATVPRSWAAAIRRTGPASRTLCSPSRPGTTAIPAPPGWGRAVPGINSYLPRPHFQAGEHMPFRGYEAWL